MTAPEFWERVDRQPAGCWRWRGALNTGGYGQLRWPGKSMTTAGRVAWLLTYGDWPPGRLRYHCGNPACVRPHPEHLALADDGEQPVRAGDGVHCTGGHPLDPRWTGREWVCAACEQERRQERQLGRLWSP